MQTHRIPPQLIHLLLLLTGIGLLLPCLATAQTPYPYPPGYGYPYATQPNRTPLQQPPQQPAANPPGYGIPPGYYRPWGQPAGPANQPPTGQLPTRQPPRAKVSLSDTTAYIQQNLVLTLRVVSSDNLSALQVRLPSLDGLAMKQLDGPLASSVMQEGQQQIANTYHFLVTPLRPGRLNIPPLQIQASLAASGEAFAIDSGETIAIDVQPGNDQVKPWLPLNGLILQAYLEETEKPAAGKPLGLVIDISAVGAAGQQLPSLEPQLTTADFRIYREETEARGRLSGDARLLLGTRTERYTLVPQHGGRLQLPELTIPWWNIDTHSAQLATIPIRQIVVQGEGPDSTATHPTRDLFPGASTLLLWLPLSAVFLITLGFWVLAWLRKKRMVQVVEEELAMAGFLIARQLQALHAWLSPIRRLQKLRQIFVRNLPRSFRLWFCVKLVDGEPDPEVWSYMLRFLAHKHLGLSPQLPLLILGRELVTIHSSDLQRMDRLMEELNAAIYGGRPIAFTEWKQRFRRLLRPRLFSTRRRLNRRRPLVRLPPLNP